MHLIHPALVHFSLAFIFVGCASEVCGLLSRRDSFARWGSRLTLIGLASLVLTIASGYLAANTLDFDDEGLTLLDSHERNGWILLGVLFVSQFWKAWCGGRIPDRLAPLYVLMLTAALALTVWGAWLGGQMVYGQGIGVF